MSGELLLALVLFFAGLAVFIAIAALVFYYDRKYYGKKGIERNPEDDGGED